MQSSVFKVAKYEFKAVGVFFKPASKYRECNIILEELAEWNSGR